MIQILFDIRHCWLNNADCVAYDDDDGDDDDDVLKLKHLFMFVCTIQ